MANSKHTELLEEEALDMIAGGLTNILPECKNHTWVFTGSHTDANKHITWNYYKCSRCGAEKTEQV